MLPYTYSIARQAVSGLPIIRAMFLEDPSGYSLKHPFPYQYMYGPYILVAPVYRQTLAGEKGNDVRNGIYLPRGRWIDYFSGDVYEGGCILNSFDAPIWKLPVFVKAGAIIPMAEPSNNVSQIDPEKRIYEFYPHGESSFEEYDDDGTSQSYLRGEYVKTLIESDVEESSRRSSITIHPSEGSFEGFVPEKATELRINVTKRPDRIKVRIGRRKVKLSRAGTIEE